MFSFQGRSSHKRGSTQIRKKRPLWRSVCEWVRMGVNGCEWVRMGALSFRLRVASVQVHGSVSRTWRGFRASVATTRPSSSPHGRCPGNTRQRWASPHTSSKGLADLGNNLSDATFLRYLGLVCSHVRAIDPAQLFLGLGLQLRSNAGTSCLPLGTPGSGESRRLDTGVATRQRPEE